jgi:hypothetical protein
MSSPSHLRAYSLVEISIVLLIIGVLTGGVLKGLDLLESAKIRSTSLQFHTIFQSIEGYHELFGYWPGDDPTASRYLNTASGNGDSLITGIDCALVWTHLFQAKFLPASQPPASRLGGVYSVESNVLTHPGNWLILSNPQYKSLLTPLQAHRFKMMMDGKGVNPQEGHCVLESGQDEQGQHCFRNQQLNFSYNRPACIAMMSLDSAS